MAALIANVAEANQRMEDLSAEIQTAQANVNKALVDVETARDNATAAEHDLEGSQQGVKDANAAIAGAQHRFDTFAAATYMNGPSDAYLTATSPEDIIATETAARTLTASSQAVMDNLQRTRTEQVNKESAARAAKQKADKAVGASQSSQNRRGGGSGLRPTQVRGQQQGKSLDLKADECRAAQPRLDAARTWSASAADRGPARRRPLGSMGPRRRRVRPVAAAGQRR